MALNRIPGAGAKRLNILVEHFESPEAAWRGDVKEISRLPGWGESLCASFSAYRRQIDPAQEYDKVLRLGAQVWTLEDECYPERLRYIANPPPVLYVKGASWPKSSLMLAVVGVRKATAYGRRAARELAGGLAAEGATVVSGLARGIDTEAHRGALEAGGYTVGVLGCGLDIVYPPENEGLYRIIGERGALVTEFPPGFGPKPGNFPARNRIISGLSQGVVVVEAGRKSGALITSNLALEQGRDVFAVPGQIFSPMSLGTNDLIRQGAVAVTSAADILEEYGKSGTRPVADKAFVPATDHREKKVLELLAGGAVQLEALAEWSGYNISELAQVLTLLELKGLVKQLPGKQFMAITDGN